MLSQFITRSFKDRIFPKQIIWKAGIQQRRNDMKNLLRIFVTVGLLVLFAFSMTGCGSDNGYWYVPTKAPAAPTGVTAVFTSSNSATVSWDAVDGATSYNVYYSTVPGVTKTVYTATVNTAATSYTFDTFAPDTTYYFVVTAVKGSKESVESIEVSAKWVLALYGTTVGTDVLGVSDLVLLDPDTGAYVRTIGSVGYYVHGLTYDTTNNKLYGTTSSNDPVFPDGLIEINTSTGAGTPIGTGAGMPVSCPTVNSLGAMFAWNEITFDLVSIDKATGLATDIGNSGLAPSPTSQQGLAFDNSDILTLVDPDGAGNTNAYSIDTASGANTYLTTFLLLPQAPHGDFDPRTNYYWGIDQTEASAGGTAPRNLLVLDIGTTTLVSTLPTADYLDSVTFGYMSVSN